MNAPARGALMRLEGKTAMIAGAAGPMGEAVARRFVEEGAAVLLFDTSGRRLDEVASRLERRDRVITHRGDSLVEGDVQAAVAASLSAFERLDILVNIVGGIVSHRIAADPSWCPTTFGFAAAQKENDKLRRATSLPT